MNKELSTNYHSDLNQQIAVYEPSQSAIDSDDINLLDLWRVIKKYKWTIFAFFLLVTATTLVLTLLMRPVYSATALIEVKPDKGTMVKFQNIETETVETTQFLETQVNILKSKAIAEAVIKKLDLASNPEINGDLKQRSILTGAKGLVGYFSGLKNRGSNEQDNENKLLIEETQRLDNFINRLKVNALNKSYLFQVSFESFNPKLSADITNTVIDEFVRLNIDRKIESSSGAKLFLQREIEKVQAKLESSEKTLTEYARANKIIDVEDKGNIMNERLSDLSAQITNVENERVAAETLYEQANSSENLDSIRLVLSNELVQGYKREQATIQAEYFKLSRIFKPAYPKLVQLKSQMDELQNLINVETNRIVDGIKKNYEQLQSKENRLSQALSNQKQQILDLQDRSIQYNILKREWETNKELYKGLLERIKEVGVAAGIELNNISNVDKARVPISSSKPNYAFNLTLASAIGLFAGIVLAFLLNLLDNTIRTVEEFEGITNLPCLGVLPFSRRDKNDRKEQDNDTEPPSGSMELIVTQNKTDPLSEAFRSIRTSLMFSSAQGIPKSLQITSSGPGEGKTTISCNLASVLAASGHKVLLIDCDLRKPRIHKIFKIPSSPGLTEMLIDEFDINKLHKLKDQEVYILPSGILPPNPAELLGSIEMGKLIEKAQDSFDHVILDCAPILGLADSVVMTTKVTGVVFVSKFGEVNKDVLKQAVKRLKMVRAPILGGILNGVDLKSDEYVNYGQYYYQYQQEG